MRFGGAAFVVVGGEGRGEFWVGVVTRGRGGVARRSCGQKGKRNTKAGIDGLE